MHQFLDELRLAARQLRTRALVSSLAILSLALGIGFNTTVFTLVDGVLHGGPPFAQPDRLVDLYLSEEGPDGYAFATFSWPDARDLRASTQSLAAVAGFQYQIAAWDDGERTRMLLGEEVTANYFAVMGLFPALGRGFRPEEEAPGAGTVMVLGHGFWQRELHGDPGVIGRHLRLSGVDFTVIGVAPPALSASTALIASEFFIPIGMHDALSERPGLEHRGHRSLLLRARLAEGVEIAQVQAELDTLARRLAAAEPQLFGDRRMSVVPTRDVVLNPGIDAPVTAVGALIMALVSMVLLIACSNIANLLLARATDRRREMAIRLALGASRFRLVRQLLTESLLVAVVGGSLGLLLAAAGVRAIVGFRPDLPLPISLHLTDINIRSLMFTLLVSLGTGILCGLAPALQGSRPALIPALKDAVPVLGRLHRRFGLRNILVVAQVAVSTILLIGAGLFVRSLQQANTIDPGFALRQGAAVSVALGLGGRRSPEEIRTLLQQIETEVAALPGVRSAATVEFLPLSLQMSSRGLMVEGQEPADSKDWPEISTTDASPGYFTTLGIQVLRGRDFQRSDAPDGARVVVVNQTFAERFWPQQEPLGKRVRFGDGPEDPWYEVIGVVANGKYQTLGEEPRPFIYRHLFQETPMVATVIAASDSNEAALLAALRKVIENHDREIPIFASLRMSEHLSLMLFPARLGAGLLTAFGLLGLVLAAAGLYGVVADSVARRTREVGIRVALGAEQSAILRLVMREGMVLVGIGLALGITLTAFGARLLVSLLYGVAPTDPVTFLGVPALLVSVALLANLLPARRALAVTPVEALRHE